MKGDFTRDTFHPIKHFSRVLQQQGRVTVDADANEQSAILLHMLRQLARDLIGPYAAPRESGGFDSSSRPAVAASRSRRAATMSMASWSKTMRTAPTARSPTGRCRPTIPSPPDQGACREQGVLALSRRVGAADHRVEDPSIREKALGGPGYSGAGQGRVAGQGFADRPGIVHPKHRAYGLTAACAARSAP